MPLDVVLCVYSFVVCIKHLLASDCHQLMSSFPNAPGVFVLFQDSEFLHVWSSGSIAKLLFVVVVLISTLLFSSCCCCLFLVVFLLYT
jgi:hypothetical protein